MRSISITQSYMLSVHSSWKKQLVSDLYYFLILIVILVEALISGNTFMN